MMPSHFNVLEVGAGASHWMQGQAIAAIAQPRSRLSCINANQESRGPRTMKYLAGLIEHVQNELIKGIGCPDTCEGG
jgi:hypothetical protein